MGESTIGEIALKLIENKLKLGESGDGLLCVGPKGSGKSTLINIFLDKDDTKPKETLGLEYTYGRKNVGGQYTDKSVCHVWELGGGIRPTKELLSVPVGATITLVMVNLEGGKELWGPLKEYASLETHGRRLFIVGGKYDMFQRLDMKEKTLVYKMLRGIALLTGAGVFMFSNKDHGVMKRARDLLNQITFNANTGAHMKTQVGDVEKPLQVSPGGGGDSWDGLGCGRAMGWCELEEWLLGSRVAEHSSSQPPQDPSLDVSFKEPLIDALRIRKDNELEAFISAHGRSYL